MLKRRSVYLVAFALASPWMIDAAGAAGLGRLTVASIQGQPFKAEIDLVAVKKEEKSLLTARLASQEGFRQASVDYLPVLSTFQATIETRANGAPYVRIVSPQSVSEPLLNILVELNWPSGRLLREYTVVLPHSEHDGNPIVKQARGPSPVVSTKVESAANKNRAGLRHDTNRPRVAEPVATVANSASYGPVREGDTLVGIVKNMTGARGASMNQTLIALHRANPDAFIGDNIHELKAGATLRIPDGNEISAIAPVEADRIVQLQTAEWRQRRLPLIARAPEELKQTVTGTIERTAELNLVSAKEPATEVLRLSKGVEPRGQEQVSANHAATPGEKQHANAQDQSQAMEEDATARERALREANERVALLEKNIKELQRLLELKNVPLAEMQRKAERMQPDPETLSPDALHPQAAPESVADGGAVAVARQSSENAEATGTKRTDSTRTTTSEATISDRIELAKPARSAKLNHEIDLSNTETGRRGKVSFLDGVMANFEYLGGALVLLLTGIVGVSMVRGSKSSSVFESDYDDGTDSSTLPQKKGESGIVMRSEADPAGPSDVIHPQASPQSHRTGMSLTIPELCLEPAATPTPMKCESEGGASVSLVVAEARVEATTKPLPVEYETERDTNWPEILTKLDLARAYQEMDDKESARQILEEILREGDKRQREHVIAILNRL
ncbi:MAG TPA: FimV/HubP family polar landmark protein [Nitrosospira sp.]|nr:FimV/HubP family polar landmark protein [Nitrosospira sp.]